MIYNVYGDVINANDLELIDSSFGYRNEIAEEKLEEDLSWIQKKTNDA